MKKLKRRPNLSTLMIREGAGLERRPPIAWRWTVWLHRQSFANTWGKLTPWMSGHWPKRQASKMGRFAASLESSDLSHGHGRKLYPTSWPLQLWSPHNTFSSECCFKVKFLVKMFNTVQHSHRVKIDILEHGRDFWNGLTLPIRIKKRQTKVESFWTASNENIWQHLKCFWNRLNLQIIVDKKTSDNTWRYLKQPQTSNHLYSMIGLQSICFNVFWNSLSLRIMIDYKT